MTANIGGIGTVHQEPVMGTVVTFDVVTPASTGDVEAALRTAVKWLHWVDATFRTFKPDSEVCRFDRGELELDDCSPELRHVFALCHRFNDETDGFFDAWAGGSFDPSGVVKGWSIEEASRLLAEAGLPDHLIDGGGDVRLRGAPGPDGPWHVGVRHPLRAGCLLRYVGTWRRGRGHFGHVRTRPPCPQPFHWQTGHRARLRHGRRATSRWPTPTPPPRWSWENRRRRG